MRALEGFVCSLSTPLRDRCPTDTSHKAQSVNPTSQEVKKKKIYISVLLIQGVG